MVSNPGDALIGDNEDGPASNHFAFPDAFDLRTIVTDDTTPPEGIKWSYYDWTGRIRINGASSLDAGNLSAALAPPAGQSVEGQDSDSAQADADPFTVTLRNQVLSPIGGPNIEPGRDGIITTQTATITLFASDGEATGSQAIAVFTGNNRNDAMLRGGVIIDEDFGSDPGAWTGFVLLGTGSTSRQGGLCMGVPAFGDNVVLWTSPERYIELLDNTLYRIRIQATTNQSTPEAIPIWNILYTNFHSSGFGNVYGGESWFLDVAGGAEAIGRPGGRSEFEVYVAPNAAQTAQWRGLVDPENSAVSPGADAYNDMSVIFRLLDLGSANINANFDEGTVCVTSIAVRAFPMDSLNVESTILAAPLRNATHAAISTGAGGENAIDDATGTARFALTPAGNGARKALIPFDPSRDNGVNLNLQLFPLVWETNVLYRGRLRLRSDVAGGAEGTDPVDTIFLAFDTPTVELGQTHFTTRGAPGNLYRAASPRLAATTGGTAQTYTGFFFGQNTTNDINTPDANRFRFFADFINNADIGPEGQGGDPFVIESLEVDRITRPN